MKKRVIAFILIFAFTLPLFSVPAYAKYDGEILFRGIPFGTSYDDAIAILAEDQIIVNSKKSAYEAKTDKSTDGLPLITVYGISVADLDRVKTSYQFINPDEKDLSLNSSIFYKGKYEKTIYNSNNHEYSELHQKLVVLLESLYGEKTSSKGNQKYGMFEQIIDKWETDDALITLDLNIDYGEFIPYVGLTGTIDFLLTYEYKPMLNKEKYYIELKQKQAEQKKNQAIISNSSTDGL